jgi:copper chaperone CopZ
MKKTLLTLAFAGAMLSAAAKTAAADTTVVFNLDPETPMHCESCEERIKGDVRFVKGVKEIRTSLDDQTVSVKYNPAKTSTEKIVKALEKLGYNATTKQK